MEQHPDLDMQGNPVNPPDLDMNGNPISGGDIPPMSLDTFKGENYRPSSLPFKKPEVSGVPPRGLSIGAAPTPIQFPAGFHGPQESIGARVQPEIKPHYGYGPEWDNLGIGAGKPPEGNETPSPYAVNLLQKLKEFHEAPPLIPGGGKFLGNIVDPYQPGFGQDTTSHIAGIGARAVGDLASGLTTPENLAIAAAFEGANLGAAGAAGEKEALRSAPGVAKLLKEGGRLHPLEVPGMQRIARNYVEGQIIRDSNKALQVGAGGYFAGQSASQIPNAENPEQVVSGVLGTALGGLGMYHGLKGLRGSPVEEFDPTTATREQFIQEALKRATNPVSDGKITLPEGFTAKVGKVDRDVPAMVKGKEVVFDSQESMDNPSVFNHEAVHTLLKAMPEEARNKLIDMYVNQKQNNPKWKQLGKDYMVQNGFHKEDLAIDLGNYFTHPEFVEPGVTKVFDLWKDRLGRGETPVVKTETAAPLVETKPPDLTMEGKPVVGAEHPEFHHGLLPPSKESITIRGTDPQSIDRQIQMKEMEGYKAVDVSPDGGIIMTRAAKVVPKPKVTGPNVTGIESEVRRALEDATQGLQNLSERNRIERAKRFAAARGVKATGLEGVKQVLGSMKGKYGDVTMEPLKLTNDAADKIANKIWVNTYDDIPTQLHANTALLKMLDGVNPVRSELEAFSRATGIETRDLFAEYYHGEVGPDVVSIVDKRRNWTTELINLPRTLQASMDLSAPFRQGIGLIHTKGWWTNWGTMVKAMGSETYYRSAMDEILSRPEFQKIRGATGKVEKSVAARAGIKLTDLVNNREESMLSSWAEKVPGVRASNRAYVAFLDKLRADTFRDLLKSAHKAALKADDINLDPFHNDVLLKKIGDYINNASGRGDLGSLEKAAVGLNAMFFSPRLIASRLQMLNPKNYIFQPAFVRQQYLKSMIGFATAWTTMAGLAKLGGAQVNLDPDNADFMKIRIGNTRLDMGGGFQQYLVLAHRMYSNRYASSTNGRDYTMGQRFGQNDRRDALINFIQNKLAPVPNVAMQFMGATRGQPMQIGDTAARMFTPMFIQDLVSISREDPSLLWMAGLSGVGGGASTYDNKGGGYTFIPPKSDVLYPSNARVR